MIRTRPFLIAFALLTTAISFGAKDKTKGRLQDALKAAPAVKNAFAVQKTKAGTKFFVGTFGPCACVTDRLIVTCVKDISNALKSAVKASSEAAKIVCGPSAGCAVGVRTVYVECPETGTTISNYESSN